MKKVGLLCNGQLSFLFACACLIQQTPLYLSILSLISVGIHSGPEFVYLLFFLQ